MSNVTVHQSPMEEDGVSRLAVIGSDIYLNTPRVHRQKTWARLQTCLIDEPNDQNSTQRQAIWSYHHQNRGLIRSLLECLPSVPYRIPKRSQGVHISFDEDTESCNTMSSEQKNQQVKFPRVQQFAEKFHQNRDSKYPVLALAQGTDNVAERVRQRLRHRQEIFNVRDKAKPHYFMPVNQENGMHNKLKTKPALTLDKDDSQSSSDNSDIVEGAPENFGPSSHNLLVDNPKSVLDILSATANHHLKECSIEKTNDGKEAEWLQKFVKEQDVINMTAYENFARTRPLIDANSSTVQPKQFTVVPNSTQSRGIDRKFVKEKGKQNFLDEISHRNNIAGEGTLVKDKDLKMSNENHSMKSNCEINSTNCANQKGKEHLDNRNNMLSPYIKNSVSNQRSHYSPRNVFESPKSEIKNRPLKN